MRESSLLRRFTMSTLVVASCIVGFCIPAQAQAAKLVPVFGLYSPSRTDHMLSANPNDVLKWAKAANGGYVTDTTVTYGQDANGGYGQQGWLGVPLNVVGFVYNAAVPNTVPLYRLYNATTQQHSYTTSTDEVQALTASGWALQPQGALLPAGTIGWVYTQPGFVTQPLYEYSDATDTITSADPALDATLGSSTTYGNRKTIAHINPLFYKEHIPAGIKSGTKPLKEIVITIHGGGWVFAGQSAALSTDDTALKAFNWGYQSYTIDYRPANYSMQDVLWFYDSLRLRYPTTRVSLYGESAGGHLALMLSHFRPDVSGVADVAGPVDLNAFHQANPANWVEDGWENLYQLGIVSFGSADPFATTYENLVAYSAAYVPEGQSTPVAPYLAPKLLLAQVVNDFVIPVQQQRELAQARPDAIAMELPGGLSTDPYFVHVRTAQTNIDAYIAAYKAFLASIAA